MNIDGTIIEYVNDKNKPNGSFLIMMDNSVHIGDKIKQLFEAQNTSVEIEAKKLGYTKEAMYKVFRKSDVNTEMLKKLCRIYNVDVLYFFSQEGVNFYRQKGRVNTIGSANVQYYENESTDIKLLEKEVRRLESENKGLNEQIILYKEIIDLLKEKK